MARRPTPRQRLESLSDRFEQQLQIAFLAAIDDLRNGAQIGLIAERLERGDIDGALRALNIEPAAFRLFEEGIREAFIGGGVAATGAMPVLRDPDGARLVTRFDARSPGAERFMTELAGRNLRVIDDVLVSARQTMTQGLVDGRNPRSVALDLAGRINRATGRREGGIIGLSSVQERYVATARQDLLSGDPERLRHYLTLKRRHKRFDRSVLAAIREGRALPVDVVDRISGKLSDSYLLLRGEIIARLETNGALHSAQRDSFGQLIDAGQVQRQQVTKSWLAAPNTPAARDKHQAMNGETVQFDQPFSNGLMFPCDPNGDISETAGCRCGVHFRINYFANLT